VYLDFRIESAAGNFITFKNCILQKDNVRGCVLLLFSVATAISITAVIVVAAVVVVIVLILRRLRRRRREYSASRHPACVFT
jgi:uncharacterized membrane protein